MFIEDRDRVSKESEGEEDMLCNEHLSDDGESDHRDGEDMLCNEHLSDDTEPTQEQNDTKEPVRCVASHVLALLSHVVY